MTSSIIKGVTDPGHWSCTPFQIGWSGGAMALGKLPVPGRPTIWMIVGQGPTAVEVGAGGDVWTFLLSSIPFLFRLTLSLGDGAI